MTREEQQAFGTLWEQRPLESRLTPKLRTKLVMRQTPMEMFQYYPREKRFGPSPAKGTFLEGKLPPWGILPTWVPLDLLRGPLSPEALNETRYAYLIASLEGDLRRLPANYQRLYHWLEVLPSVLAEQGIRMRGFTP